VSGGKANIHPTDPPPDLEPNIPSITKLREPQKQAENKPREEHHERGFQEHSLRLRELLDGVESEERLGQAERVVIDAGVGGDGGVPLEEHACVIHTLEHVAGGARAEGGVIGDGVRGARRHWS